jgi:hypothetical protein
VADPKEGQPPEPAVNIGRAGRPKDWWWVELWYENRQLFKELIKHAVIFAFFAVALELYHRTHKGSQLPPEEAVWFNKIHFYGYIVLLVILGGILFIKVAYIELKGIRR